MRVISLKLHLNMKKTLDWQDADTEDFSQCLSFHEGIETCKANKTLNQFALQRCA